jgi:hypothetical protein
VRGQAVIHKRTSTVPYQIAARTSRPAQEVLAQFDLERVPATVVAERGAHYLVIRPARRFRYGADLAAGLAIAIVLALLILTAVTPVVLVALPVAFLPALPLLLDHRPDLALSAIEDDGETRVTAHGQASPDLAEYLDRYLESLPPVEPEPPETDAEDDGWADAEMSEDFLSE